MIAVLVVLFLLGAVLASDLILELSAGAALLSLPFAIILGEWATALTAALLLVACIWVMARRDA